MAKYIQDHMWQDSIFAIKLSCKASEFETFYGQLLEKLPQTSEETRRRNAGTIVRRFFPEKILAQKKGTTQLPNKLYVTVSAMALSLMLL